MAQGPTSMKIKVAIFDTLQEELEPLDGFGADLIRKSVNIMEIYSMLIIGKYLTIGGSCCK